MGSSLWRDLRRSGRGVQLGQRPTARPFGNRGHADRQRLPANASRGAHRLWFAEFSSRSNPRSNPRPNSRTQPGRLRDLRFDFAQLQRLVPRTGDAQLSHRHRCPMVERRSEARLLRRRDKYPLVVFQRSSAGQLSWHGPNHAARRRGRAAIRYRFSSGGCCQFAGALAHQLCLRWFGEHPPHRCGRRLPSRRHRPEIFRFRQRLRWRRFRGAARG